MRAVIKESFESAPVVGDVPRPTPEAGQLLVRVAASSFNAFDRAVAAGYLQGRMEHRFPLILGRDFAGTVEAVGEGAVSFVPGDRVFGMVTTMVIGDGAFAEYVSVPEALGVASVPTALAPAQAGALGIAALAAMNAVDAAAASTGQTVLISGATGAVGSYAIQLASARGTRVIATARTRDAAAFVRDLGASDVVDYSDDLAGQVHAISPGGVDAIIHLAGDGVALADLVAPGGRLVSATGVAPDALAGRDLTFIGVMANPARSALDTLAALVATGHLRVPITATYSLAEAAQAFGSSDHVLGKASVIVGEGAW